MRAAFCPAAGVIELREVPLPDPGAGEVIVRVRACGICGSDLHWFQGALPPPRVCPGHEIAGEVAACGAGVRAVREGDRVAIEPMVVCRECRYCRAGTPQRCPHMRILGMHRPGGLADMVAVPAYALFGLPTALAFELGALAEPTAVCVHAVRSGGVAIGDRVLVLGAGTIGLLAVLTARAAGASEVAITARHAHQAAMARALGATQVFTTTADGEQELATYAAERAIDTVIETVGGSADTIADAVRAVRPGGTVVVLGVFSTAPALPALLLIAKEIRIIGAMMYARPAPRADFEVALDLLERRREVVAGLITHRIALDAVQSAFTTAADKRSGAIKVTVLP
jgi:2-desacetyl-2-hydroxyethyl bacteriochlorophyllide A dehydrogenase